MKHQRGPCRYNSGRDLYGLRPRRQIRRHHDPHQIESWRCQPGEYDARRFPAHGCRNRCAHGKRAREYPVRNEFRWIERRANADHVQIENVTRVHLPHYPWVRRVITHQGCGASQRRSYEKRLMILIENGVEKNEVRPINPYVAVLTILSAVRGLEFWYGHKKNVTQLELENEMVNHLLNGIIK